MLTAPIARLNDARIAACQLLRGTLRHAAIAEVSRHSCGKVSASISAFGSPWGRLSAIGKCVPELVLVSRLLEPSSGSVGPSTKLLQHLLLVLLPLLGDVFCDQPLSLEKLKDRERGQRHSSFATRFWRVRFHTHDGLYASVQWCLPPGVVGAVLRTDLWNSTKMQSARSTRWLVNLIKTLRSLAHEGVDSVRDGVGWAGAWHPRDHL